MIANGRNLGFAAGANVGMKRALDQGADYVLLVNNDTVVEPIFWPSFWRKRNATRRLE